MTKPTVSELREAYAMMERLSKWGVVESVYLREVKKQLAYEILVEETKS